MCVLFSDDERGVCKEVLKKIKKNMPGIRAVVRDYNADSNKDFSQTEGERLVDCCRLYVLPDERTKGSAIWSKLNLGTSDPVLHAHVTPRYASEPEERRKWPVWFYDLSAATHFDPDKHGALQARIAQALTELGLLVGDTQHVV